MTARLMTLLIWAAVAASAVYWGLRLFTPVTPVPAGAAVAEVAAAAAGGLNRLLGAPPVQVAKEEDEDDAEVLPADGRFRLVGVVAPRSGSVTGLALISVDGKPPRAVAVGRELEPGLRLLSVSHRQAELGAGRGQPAMTLALPALAEAQRGRPGEVSPMGQPGAQPGAMPQPAFGRPGAPFVAPGGVPPAAMMPRVTGGMPAQAPAMPGTPIRTQPDSDDGPETPADRNALQTQ